MNHSEQSAGGSDISLGSIAGEDHRINNYNPIEKVAELYERLLKEKDEKYAALERRLQHIEQSMQK